MSRLHHLSPRHVRVAVLVAVLLVSAGLALGQSRALALDPGTNAQVRADGDCLRMRAQPSLQGAILFCIPDRTVVSVLEGSVEVDGLRWQRIQSGGFTGWSVETYLVAVAGTPGVPTSVPTSVATQPPASTPIPTPELNASLPTNGGIALGVWGGGPIDRIPPITASRGCTLRAIWVTQDGDFIGFIYGAPGIVNERWNATYGGSLGGGQPLLLVCASSSAGPAPTPAPTSTAPPTGPVATPGVPPGVPPLPPGPAGNG